MPTSKNHETDTNAQNINNQIAMQIYSNRDPLQEAENPTSAAIFSNKYDILEGFSKVVSTQQAFSKQQSVKGANDLTADSNGKSSQDATIINGGQSLTI